MGVRNKDDRSFNSNCQKLRKAAFYNQITTVSSLIEQQMKENQSTRWINQFDKFGWSALHYASFQGNLTICQALVKAGADVNLRTERAGETPLFLAAAVDESKIVDYLINEAQVDPNISDITGKIPLEVASGKSKHIISEERLKHGRIIRLIPTVRKLLASKFTQILLQLVLCIFLELFQDKLIAVLQRALQLIALLGPGVRQFIVGVFDRMLAPVVMPFISMLTPLMSWFITPLFIIVNSIFQSIFNTLMILLGPILLLFSAMIRDLVSPFMVLFYELILPLWNISTLFVLGFFSMTKAIFLSIIWQTVMVTKGIGHLFGYLLLPFRFIFQIIWSVIQNSSVYIQLARIISMICEKSWKVIWHSLQPKQLAGKLVSPIILGASKILSILPNMWVDAIAYNYTRIAGKDRHISDEEVAAATLFLAGIGTYIFGILLGGYFLRSALVLLYHFDWYGGDYFSIHDLFGFYRNTDYAHFEWKPDGALHELGLLFTTFAIPTLIILKIIRKITEYIIKKIKQWRNKSKIRVLTPKELLPETILLQEQEEEEEIAKEEKMNEMIKHSHTFERSCRARGENDSTRIEPQHQQIRKKKKDFKFDKNLSSDCIQNM